MKRLAPLAIALFLGGCAWDAAPTPIPAPTQCVPKRAWTGAEMTALAGALAPLPDTSILFVLEADWQRMRDDPHACKE